MSGGTRSKNLLLLLTSLLACGALTEVFLRLMGRTGHFSLGNRQSGAYLLSTSYWKLWHYPDVRVHFVKGCIDVTYSTNSFGMRGGPFEGKRGSIVLLGDSFIEGFGVNDDATIARYLENFLNDRYEVLNFGVSGGFATVHETALYENYARFFRPEYVVLFFMNYNDLYDNLNAVREGMLDAQLRFTYPGASGLDQVRSALRNESSPVAPLFAQESSLHLMRLLSSSLRVAWASLQYWSNIRAGFSKALTEVYAEPPSEAIRRGWLITELSLARLRQLASADGVRLLVVDLPDPYQTDANWFRLATFGSGKKLDPRTPNRTLEGICRRLDIAYYDMYPDAEKYIAAHDLRFPYLSHTCDRHYDESGNRVVADMVAERLQTLLKIEQ
jgi:hypothetical protein